MADVLIRVEEDLKHRDIYRTEDQVKTEQKLYLHFPLTLQRECGPANTLISEFWPPEL